MSDYSDPYRNLIGKKSPKYSDKWNVGDYVKFHGGEGRITHIKYDDEQGYAKINGQYIAEKYIIGFAKSGALKTW